MTIIFIFHPLGTQFPKAKKLRKLFKKNFLIIIIIIDKKKMRKQKRNRRST